MPTVIEEDVKPLIVPEAIPDTPALLPFGEVLALPEPMHAADESSSTEHHEVISSASILVPHTVLLISQQEIRSSIAPMSLIIAREPDKSGALTVDPPAPGN